MASYYISTDTVSSGAYNGASDTNVGTDTNNPWLTIAKVNSSSFSADDFIYFEKDDTWTEQLNIPSSGTAGHPITFGAYGAGANPIIDGEDTRDHGMYCGNDYMVIDGIDVVNTVKDGFYWVGTAQDVTFQNLTVHDTGESGIKTYLTTGTVNADNVTAYNTGRHGIFFDGAVAGTIENCTAHDVNIGAVFWYHCICVADGHNLTVQNNTLYNATSGNGGSGIGGDGYQDCTFQNNTIYNVTQAGIDLTGDDTPSECTGNIVRYNKIYNVNGAWVAGILLYTHSTDDGRESDNNEIYYNIIYDSKGSNNTGITIKGECDSNKIYNNVFYDCDYGIFITSNGANVPNGNLIKNNIFHTASTQFIWVESGLFDDNVMDYNCFYDTSLTNKWYYGSSYSSLSAWQTATSQDANSLSANPQFIDPTSDFNIQPWSTCIDAGVNVSLTADYDADTVPYNSVVDIGAQEYQGAGAGSGTASGEGLLFGANF